MNEEYKIEIGITPHYHDNKFKPFYWTLLAYRNGWSNDGCGWATTQEEAWKEAYRFYKTHITK